MNSKIILEPPKSRTGTSSHSPVYGIVISLLLVVVAAALLVVFYLPQYTATEQVTVSQNDPTNIVSVADQKKAAADSIDTIKTQNTLPTTSKPQDTTQSEQNLNVEKVSLALQDYLRTKSDPLLDQAQIWAADKWQASLELAEQAELALRKQNYQLATQTYNYASSILSSLIEQRPDILEMHFEQAQEDLQANRVEQAIAGFNQVLSMDEGHSPAEIGLSRAKVREQVLSLIAQAQNALARNELEAALAYYQNASKMDKQYPQIEQIITNLSQKIKQIQFDEYISAANEFLLKGALDDAQKSVNHAFSIIAGDSTAKTLQDEIKMRKLAKSFTETMQQAKRYRRNEQWQNAVDKYHRALTLKPGASKVKAALQFAQQRLTLHNTLDAIIDEPTSLFNKTNLIQAEQLMASLAVLSYQGEIALENKAKNLNDFIAKAKTPLTLSLRSDALTEVIIYPAAKLGNFHQKDLRLRPGSYVITGTRAGFRDIRKTVKLLPGTLIPPIEIKCNETI